MPGSMAQRGAVGLVAEIEMNRLAGERLAAIPHDRRKKRRFVAGSGRRNSDSSVAEA